MSTYLIRKLGFTAKSTVSKNINRSKSYPLSRRIVIFQKVEYFNGVLVLSLIDQCNNSIHPCMYFIRPLVHNIIPL